MIGWPFRRKSKSPVSLEEILLDASNLPSFNQGRLEGRLELPIARRNIYVIGILFILAVMFFWGKVFSLQITNGGYFSDLSENNSVDRSVIVAERGVIYDRQGEMLAWNSADKTDRHDFPARAYSDRFGLGQLLGYVSYPQKDAHGFYYRTEYLGVSGAEGALDDTLSGRNGYRIFETNALGEVVSEHVVDSPRAGEPVTLSLDARLSEAMFDRIVEAVEEAGFRSGAGAIIDVENGELIALASFPSYDPEVMADGKDADLIASYNEDERFPFLNKVIGGVYTPGSVVKPFVAYGALEENVIHPEKIIVSTGELVIPNPYNPSQPSRFTDWRAHGRMNMREAIAYSSNVYFYQVSGGYRDQPGLGITKLHSYFDKFGFGQISGIELDNEQRGTVPNPDWKQSIFGDDWRLGDTYLTAIGQFGFQATPLQVLRAYAALANGGKLLTPQIIKDAPADYVDLKLSTDSLQIIKEGMRMAVNYTGGTARSLDRSDVAIAAKSGTAEIGAGNAFVNSWAAGFFPYESPRYAFVIMMDRAPRANTLGATRVAGDLVEWMSQETPEYLGLPPRLPEEEENKSGDSPTI